MCLSDAPPSPLLPRPPTSEPGPCAFICFSSCDQFSSVWGQGNSKGRERERAACRYASTPAAALAPSTGDSHPSRAASRSSCAAWPLLRVDKRVAIQTQRRRSSVQEAELTAWNDLPTTSQAQQGYPACSSSAAMSCTYCTARCCAPKAAGSWKPAPPGSTCRSCPPAASAASCSTPARSCCRRERGWQVKQETSAGPDGLPKFLHPSADSWQYKGTTTQSREERQRAQHAN